MDEVGFVVKYTMFYLILFFVIGLGAYDIFLTGTPDIAVPAQPTGILETITWFFDNIGLLFSLMFIPVVDPAVQFISLIFTAMTVGMVLIVIKIITDLIPG